MRDLSAVFKAYDIRGIAGEQLDTDVVRDIGAAFARLAGGPAIVPGHDMRASSPGLASAFATGAVWFNLRPSNTEPLLRLNVEAADDAAVAALREEVLAIVRG